MGVSLKSDQLLNKPVKYLECSEVKGHCISWCGAVFPHTTLLRFISLREESTRRMRTERGRTFQQDTDPKHRQGNPQPVPEKENEAAGMAQPGLTWIQQETMKEPKLRVHRRSPRNLPDLERVCVEGWGKIPPEQRMQLVSPYRRRLEAHHHYRLLHRVLNTFQ